MALSCIAVWLSPLLRTGLAWPSSPVILVVMGGWLLLVETCSPAIIDFFLRMAKFWGATYTPADTVHGTLHRTCSGQNIG